MLKKFSVSNYKNFKDRITLDFTNPSNYAFNTEVIQDGLITKGLIYGINGSGKSNIGLALFDIISHITDNECRQLSRGYYLNLSSEKPYAEFEYVFSFNNTELVYRYEKKNTQTLLREQLIINNKEIVFYDFVENKGFSKLKGTETLALNGKSPISRIKYIQSNGILSDDSINEVFKKFIEYVNHMLLFFSLDTRGYLGFPPIGEGVTDAIIKTGHLKDFELFLKENGIEYCLKEKEIDGDSKIYCKFQRDEVNFFSIASTGTRSLSLFYSWYIRMKEASFVFIDEFDAFYHYELAESLLKRLKTMPNVQILLTTHNTDLISNDLLRPDCYYELEDNQLKTLAEKTNKELRKAHNLQKMYKAGAFNG